MSANGYRRILLKLSGEVFMGDSPLASTPKPSPVSPKK